MPIDLKRIVRGRVESPPRILIYGTDGIGKTGFAAGAPDPFFIDANKGSDAYDVARVATHSWDEAKELVTLVEQGQIKCKTLVLDALTDLEAMSHTTLFGAKTIDTFGRGYGEGENVLMEQWRVFLAQLERIWNQGKAIVIVAHSTVKSFDDPTGVKFDRFVVAARPRLAGLIREWCTHVLFCKEEVITEKPKDSGAKVTPSGVRWMYTSRSPAYDAKARGNFPPRILLSWSEFAKALQSGSKRGEELMAEMEAMLAEISDPKLTEQVHDYLKKEPSQVVAAHNNLTSVLERHRAKQTTAASTMNTAVANGT